MTLPQAPPVAHEWPEPEAQPQQEYVCHLTAGVGTLCGTPGCSMELHAATRPDAPECEVCGETRCPACVAELHAVS